MANAADHEFRRSPELNAQVREEFGGYFPGMMLRTSIGMMRSVGTGAGFHLPHIDSGRAMALNYYIDLGGTNVLTSFYDHVARSQRGVSQNFRYDQVKKVGHVVFEADQWYAFDTNQAHSIENIEGFRSVLTLGISRDGETPKADDYTIDRFQRDYPDVIDRELDLERG